jgi:hypothetical protein
MQALEVKALFSGMLRLSAATHRDLRNSLKQEGPSEEFREQGRRKRNPSDEHSAARKKMVPAAKSDITTRNFFAPLRTPNMETDSGGTEANTQEGAVPGKTGRPPPIILTSELNFFQLQKQLKNVVEDDFEFRNTRNGTRVVTKGTADFEAVNSNFSNKQRLILLHPKGSITDKSCDTAPPTLHPCGGHFRRSGEPGL